MWLNFEDIVGYPFKVAFWKDGFKIFEYICQIVKLLKVELKDIKWQIWSYF